MRYFTWTDVAGAGVCRVVVFGRVFELGRVLDERKTDIGAKQLLEAKGTDISHWFKPNKQLRVARIENENYNEEPFSPVGEFLDMHAPKEERWWEDERNIIGMLASRTRLIKVDNMLTGQTAVIEVPVEEKLKDIQNRYLTFNFHASSYTWKFLGRVLDMEKTLNDNQIPELLETKISVPVLNG